MKYLCLIVVGLCFTGSVKAQDCCSVPMTSDVPVTSDFATNDFITSEVITIEPRLFDRVARQQVRATNIKQRRVMRQNWRKTRRFNFFNFFLRRNR